MEFIISLLMGTRLLTLFGGGLGNDEAPFFMPPQIVITAGEVRLNCALANAFPKELKKLAQTATPVVVYLFIEIQNGDRRQPAKKITVESRLVYDMIGHAYCVTGSRSLDTLRFALLDSAIAASMSFKDVPLLSKKEVRSDLAYTVTAQAVLGKVRVEALDNQEIDCMYYWDYKRPSLKTEEIAGEQLIAKGRH
jgi:hypothetical protein